MKPELQDEEMFKMLHEWMPRMSKLILDERSGTITVWIRDGEFYKAEVEIEGEPDET